MEQAQAILADLAYHLLTLVETLETVHAGLPEPPDIDARQEGDLPYDRATDVLATIECVLEDCLRPAVEMLRQSAQATDEKLEAEYREWLARRIEL